MKGKGTSTTSVLEPLDRRELADLVVAEIDPLIGNPVAALGHSGQTIHTVIGVRRDACGHL